LLVFFEHGLDREEITPMPVDYLPYRPSGKVLSEAEETPQKFKIPEAWCVFHDWYWHTQTWSSGGRL